MIASQLPLISLKKWLLWVLLYPTLQSHTAGEVIAQPDGTLLNLGDNKEYSYLFWEGILDNNRWDMTKGFVVAGKDTKYFLQDKLSFMGLTPKEYNDFIVFWLPISRTMNIT